MFHKAKFIPFEKLPLVLKAYAFCFLVIRYIFFYGMIIIKDGAVLLF